MGWLAEGRHSQVRNQDVPASYNLGPSICPTIYDKTILHSTKIEDNQRQRLHPRQLDELEILLRTQESVDFSIEYWTSRKIIVILMALI